jgi:predicted DNA-binding antitoxin AbrB/MazE fold protein
MNAEKMLGLGAFAAYNVEIDEGWWTLTQTIQAVYSQGVLKPVRPIEGLEENRRVTVTVTDVEPGHPLAGWRGGLSDSDAAERIRVVEDEFEKVDENEW